MVTGINYNHSKPIKDAIISSLAENDEKSVAFEGVQAKVTTPNSGENLQVINTIHLKATLPIN